MVDRVPVIAREGEEKQIHTGKELLPDSFVIKKSTAVAFVVTLAVQSFHMVEHVAQIHQHAILDFSVAESQGLIGALNLEWVHWVYNLAYFILLGLVFKGYLFYNLDKRTDGQKVGILLFNVGFFLQGYHVIEHNVRMFQFFVTECTPCVGVLGVFFDGVYLHFVINFLVFIFPLATFFIFGFHKRLLMQLLRSKTHMQVNINV